MRFPEVLIVPASTTPEQQADCVVNGVLPPGSREMTLEDFKKVGRVEDCDCGHLQCVCELVRQHKDDCPLRLAISCAIPIECDKHGGDVCPICNPCTC